MMLTNVSITQAQETTTVSLSECEKQIEGCHDQIAYCEEVVESGRKYIKHLSTQLDQKSELAAALEREVVLLKQRALDTAPSWYEKPSFVVPATILATALTVIIVRKAVQD